MKSLYGNSSFLHTRGVPESVWDQKTFLIQSFRLRNQWLISTNLKILPIQQTTDLSSKLGVRFGLGLYQSTLGSINFHLQRNRKSARLLLFKHSMISTKGNYSLKKHVFCKCPEKFGSQGLHVKIWILLSNCLRSAD